jgi:NADH-quinone oxidoreductase subunit J
VKRIGEELMTHYVLPLEMVGVLLTAALLGAVVIALREEPEAKTQSSPPGPKRAEPREAMSL